MSSGVMSAWMVVQYHINHIKGAHIILTMLHKKAIMNDVNDMTRQ